MLILEEGEGGLFLGPSIALAGASDDLGGIISIVIILLLNSSQRNVADILMSLLTMFGRP